MAYQSRYDTGTAGQSLPTVPKVTAPAPNVGSTALPATSYLASRALSLQRRNRVAQAAPTPTATTTSYAPATQGTPAPSAPQAARPPLPGAAAGEERPPPPDITTVLDDATQNVPDTPDTIEGLESTSQLRSLTEVELEAFLEGIAARYGMTRAQLALQEGQLGDMARSLEVQFGRAREQAVGGQVRASSERGLLRSGLHASDVGRIDTAIGAQRTAATEQRQLQMNQIEAARAAIGGQQAAEQAQARTGVEQGLIQFEQGQTVADLLAQLPQAALAPPGPITPASPFLSDPLIPEGPGAAQLFGPSAPTQSFAGYTGIGDASAAVPSLLPDDGQNAQLQREIEYRRQQALLAQQGYDPADRKFLNY